MKMYSKEYNKNVGEAQWKCMRFNENVGVQQDWEGNRITSSFKTLKNEKYLKGMDIDRSVQ